MHRHQTVISAPLTVTKPLFSKNQGVAAMPTVAAVMEFLEAFAPLHLAADWDNVGLLLGERAANVERIVTCLTVTPEVVAEAVAEQAQLIVTHHPILFRGVKRLTDATPESRMLLSLIRQRVAVYSPHTAFDNTRDGINDRLAAKLGLTNVLPLKRRDETRQCKMVVFVPDKDLGRVSDALFAAGAGRIGEYSECSYRLAGTGTFFGSEASNPTLGQKGRREEVHEWRLEVVCPEAKVEAVVAAMRQTHSYEEPAFDVYPLRPAASKQGEGRLCELPQAMTLGDVARRIKEQLSSGSVQVIGDLTRLVRHVAVVCGAGGEMMMDALRAGAEVFLTGEMRFHDYLAAQAQGLALLLPGHYATERFAVEELARLLQQQWPDVRVCPSRSESDPAQWL
jgi:dinuclear metal center YbgI/SA1388 family protein